MAGVLLESMTRKQIIIITVVAFLTVAVFFVLGGTKVSNPASAVLYIATPCRGSSKTWKTAWHRRTYFDNGRPVQDKHAPCVEESIGEVNSNVGVNDVVFSVHMPHPGTKFHPIQQFIVVSMNAEIDLAFDEESNALSQLERKKSCLINYKAKVGYRDNENSPWTMYAHSEDERRPLQCIFMKYDTKDKKTSGYYTCEDMHFLEIGSIQHPYYLINMQLKPAEGCFGILKGLHFVGIHQNGSYTQAWLVAKTVLLPFLLAALIFFIRRVRSQPRPPILLEKISGVLGLSLLFLIIPIEWLTLSFHMPFMLLFSDLRQGLFYAALLSFWCIFVGEHILAPPQSMIHTVSSVGRFGRRSNDQRKRGSFQCYKWQLTFIMAACISLLLFDLIERGVQLHNSFHTIWKKDNGEKVAKAFIILAAASSVLFVLFFFGLVVNVFRHMRIKGNAMPAMQEARRLYYQGVIYRFRVLVGITLLSAVATVLCFVLDQVNEVHWKFIEDNPINDIIKLSSALHFGTFGLWNVYVISVLILYSPGKVDDGTSVRYRAGREGQREGLTDENPSEDSLRLSDDSISVVYQMSGQHIKD